MVKRYLVTIAMYSCYVLCVTFVVSRSSEFVLLLKQPGTSFLQATNPSPVETASRPAATIHIFPTRIEVYVEFQSQTKVFLLIGMEV